jgi:L-asparaginase II
VEPITVDVVRGGVVEARHDAEIAIASASHLHRPDQLAPARSLLEKANATESDLECGPEPTRIEHNCSGKHAAMLLLCRERGWPTEGYRLASHPCQQELLAEVAGATEVEPASVQTAVDGCGVVTYGFTLERMAHAFAGLERLEGLLCAARDGLGLALKVEDGAQRPLGAALAAFLDQLGLEFGRLAEAPVENSRGEVVGSLIVTS